MRNEARTEIRTCLNWFGTIRSPGTWDYSAVSITEASSRFFSLRVHGQHEKGNILQGPSAEYLTPYWWSWWILKNWRLCCVELNCILYVDRALHAVCRSGSYPSEGIQLESELTFHIAPFAFEYFLPGLIVQLNCDLPFEFWSFVLRPNGIESGLTILGVTHMFRSVGDRTDCWNRTQYNRHSPKGERNKGRWLVAYQTCWDCCLHPNKQVVTSYLWYKPEIGDSWQCWELGQECYG